MAKMRKKLAQAFDAALEAIQPPSLTVDDPSVEDVLTRLKKLQRECQRRLGERQRELPQSQAIEQAARISEHVKADLGSIAIANIERIRGHVELTNDDSRAIVEAARRLTNIDVATTRRVRFHHQLGEDFSRVGACIAAATDAYAEKKRDTFRERWTDELALNEAARAALVSANRK